MIKDLTSDIKNRIQKSLKNNFKYSIEWFGNQGWCIEVDHSSYYKVRDLLIDRGLVIDVIPSNGGAIAGLYQLRELSYWPK